MPRLEIRFSIPDERSFSRMWDNLAHVPEDLREPFEKMADQFLTNNEKTFALEGPGWRPLAASTLEDKRRRGFEGEPILVRTAALRESLSKVGAPGQIRRIQRQAMELGTSVPYAIYHQTGNLKADNYPPDSHPPKRAPIAFRSSLRTAWTRTMTTYLREQLAIITDGGE